MSPKSISDRETMMRMRVLSLVPRDEEERFLLKSQCKPQSSDNTHSSHGIVKLLGEEVNLRLDDLSCETKQLKINKNITRRPSLVATDGQESLLDVSGELALDGGLDVVAGHGLVLEEHLAELLVGSGDEDHVEDRLVGSPLAFAGLEQGGRVGDGGVLVDAVVLLAIALHQRHAQPLEEAGCVALQVALQGVSVELLVELGDGADAVVGQRAQDLDDGLLVGADAADGVVQLLGVELRQRGHQGEDDVLELAAQLGLEVGDQVLAEVGLEGRGDLQSLDDAAAGEDLDDRLLVGAEALHGLAQHRGVFIRVEGIGREHTGLALKAIESRKLINSLSSCRSFVTHGRGGDFYRFLDAFMFIVAQPTAP